jgi:hypothetical protein
VKLAIESHKAHPELPFDAGVVTVTLTAEQHAQLLPLVRRQVTDRLGLLLMSIAPYVEVEAGETKLRLQVMYLDWKTARKILKLIRE